MWFSSDTAGSGCATAHTSESVRSAGLFPAGKIPPPRKRATFVATPLPFHFFGGGKRSRGFMDAPALASSMGSTFEENILGMR